MTITFQLHLSTITQERAHTAICLSVLHSCWALTAPRRTKKSQCLHMTRSDAQHPFYSCRDLPESPVPVVRPVTALVRSSLLLSPVPSRTSRHLHLSPGSPSRREAFKGRPRGHLGQWRVRGAERQQERWGRDRTAP